jgi:hypothetical protein
MSVLLKKQSDGSDSSTAGGGVAKVAEVVILHGQIFAETSAFLHSSASVSV